MSYVYHVQGLSCLVFICLGSVLVPHVHPSLTDSLTLTILLPVYEPLGSYFFNYLHFQQEPVPYPQSDRFLSCLQFQQNKVSKLSCIIIHTVILLLTLFPVLSHVERFVDIDLQDQNCYKRVTDFERNRVDILFEILAPSILFLTHQFRGGSRKTSRGVDILWRGRNAEIFFSSPPPPGT